MSYIALASPLFSAVLVVFFLLVCISTASFEFMNEPLVIKSSILLTFDTYTQS